MTKKEEIDKIVDLLIEKLKDYDDDNKPAFQSHPVDLARDICLEILEELGANGMGGCLLCMG